MKTGEKIVFLLAGMMIFIVMILYVLGQFHIINFWSTGDVYVFNKHSEAGYKIYRRYGCRNCHVLYGVGDFAGPDMDGEGTRRTREWLDSYMKNPRSLVANTRHDGKFATNFSDISEEDKKKLVDLMMSLRSMPGSPNYPKPPQ
jgi:cbb3-type cytochrome oxidase cytochrome c subunit